MFCILFQGFSFSVHFACILGKIPQFVFRTTYSMLSSNKFILSWHTCVEFNSALHFYFLKTLFSLSPPFSHLVALFFLVCFLVSFFLSHGIFLHAYQEASWNVSWLGRTSFSKGCSPSGSWRYHPCSLPCSISYRSLGSLDPFSLLPEKGRPIVLFYARQEEWIGLGLSFSLLAWWLNPLFRPTSRGWASVQLPVANRLHLPNWSDIFV